MGINQATLPVYKRIDVSLFYRKQLGHMNFETGLALLNVFDIENVQSRYYQLNGSALNYANVALLGFTPTAFLSVAWENE